MKIVINGAGQIGSHLAKLLTGEGYDVTIIDNDEKRLEHARGWLNNVEVIDGDPTSIRTLKTANAGKADLFVSVFPFVNQEVNIVACMLSKRLGAKKAVARIMDTDFLGPEVRKMLHESGIAYTFCPEKIAADEIIEQLSRGNTSDSLNFANGKLQLMTFRIGEDCPMLDTDLVEVVHQFTAKEAELFRVIAISRDNETIIPKFDTVFNYGDLVYFIMKEEGVSLLRDYLGADDNEIDIKSVMIMGGGEIGEMVARGLARDHDVKVIEINRERCIELSEDLPDSVLVVNGDGRNSDFVFEESIADCDAFVASTGNDETNILACVAAKKFGVPRTVAQVENIEYARLAEEMGVDSVINKKLIAASRVFKYTLSDHARFIRYMSGTDAEVMEYIVDKDCPLTKAELKDIHFPKDAVIGGVVRGGDAFIAVGTTRIQAGDRVVVFTKPEVTKDVDKFFK